MKFKFKKAELLDVLSKIQGLAGRKSSLAITENVLIQTNPDGIVMTATDLETGFEGKYSAEVETEGSIAVKARKFFEIVRDFPNEEILVEELKNRWIKIGDGDVVYHLVCADPQEFPDTPQVQEVSFFTIDSSVFKKMIEKMVNIIGDTTETRPHVLGVFFDKIAENDSQIIRMVSTDGGRLAIVDCFYDISVDLPEETGLLIPKKGLNEVGKFLSFEGGVQLGFKDNKLVVKKENETIIVRLLEGKFPDYKHVLERNESEDILLDRHMFLMMLKRMSILSTEDYRAAIFHIENGELIVTATNPELGESKEKIPLNYHRDPLELSFNPKFFLDALNLIEGENAVINIVSENKPCLLKGESDNTYLCAIMPMRI